MFLKGRPRWEGKGTFRESVTVPRLRRPRRGTPSPVGRAGEVSRRTSRRPLPDLNLRVFP